jgi:hypothetical protein
MKARAIAILYFYPPENFPPEAPTSVSIPLSRFLMKSIAFASVKAYSISAYVASGFAKSIFSLMVVLNKMGS